MINGDELQVSGLGIQLRMPFRHSVLLRSVYSWRWRPQRWGHGDPLYDVSALEAPKIMTPCDARAVEWGEGITIGVRDAFPRNTFPSVALSKFKLMLPFQVPQIHTEPRRVHYWRYALPGPMHCDSFPGHHRTLHRHRRYQLDHDHGLCTTGVDCVPRACYVLHVCVTHHGTFNDYIG